MNTQDKPPYAIIIGIDCVTGLQSARILARHGVPVIGEYDVVVVGGGTGGAPAGIGAGRQGARTLVIETRRRPSLHVATDGEVTRMEMPLEIKQLTPSTSSSQARGIFHALLRCATKKTKFLMLIVI